MKRELTPEQRDAIIHAIIARDRVKAISIYLSAIGAGLSEAQHFVAILRAEIAAGAAATVPIADAPSRS